MVGIGVQIVERPLGKAHRAGETWGGSEVKVLLGSDSGVASRRLASSEVNWRWR